MFRPRISISVLASEIEFPSRILAAYSVMYGRWVLCGTNVTCQCRPQNHLKMIYLTAAAWWFRSQVNVRAQSSVYAWPVE